MSTLPRAITFLALAGAAGCATPPNAAKPKAADDAEAYVTLPPETGSMLPRRVKASELETQAARVQASPVGGVGGQSMREGKSTVGDALDLVKVTAPVR